MNAAVPESPPAASLPARFADEDHLEDQLSTPSQALIDDFARLEGDLIVLGVAGKEGPTLARMAKRAAPEKRVVGVARFSEAGLQEQMNSWGIETIRCDLLDADAVAKLPKLANVVYMAGKKFGTDSDPSFAWAMNTQVPATIAREFKASKIVAFSTLCVYPFAPVVSHGWDESMKRGRWATTPTPASAASAPSSTAREPGARPGG